MTAEERLHKRLRYLFGLALDRIRRRIEAPLGAVRAINFAGPHGSADAIAGVVEAEAAAAMEAALASWRREGAKPGVSKDRLQAAFIEELTGFLDHAAAMAGNLRGARLQDDPRAEFRARMDDLRMGLVAEADQHFHGLAGPPPPGFAQRRPLLFAVGTYLLGLATAAVVERLADLIWPAAS